MMYGYLHWWPLIIFFLNCSNRDICSMYGFILEGIAEAIRKKYGDDKWEEVRIAANVSQNKFTGLKIYSETLIPRLIKSASTLLDSTPDDLLELCGVAFLPYLQTSGYDRVMRVMGRHLSEFLNGLDNLHEYLRFTYPKLKAPSFFCENETRTGLMLHYRSKRKGFVYYVTGQITQVANLIYNTPIQVEILSEEESLTLTHVVMKLHFDNTNWVDPNDTQVTATNESLPLSYDTLVDVFPFHIVFNQNMIIKSIGTGLLVILPQLVGQAIDEMFSLTRPMVEFTLENVSLLIFILSMVMIWKLTIDE